MLKSFEFGGGGSKVFNIIVSISEKLSDDDFEKDIQPVIIRMFSLQERGVRMCLLENLNRVIERLNAKIINDKIFPNMVRSPFPSSSAFVIKKDLVLIVGEWIYGCCTCGSRANCSCCTCYYTKGNVVIGEGLTR
jgi:hypothetical protein